jgi:tRNA(His) guanylyltransferase
MSESLGDRIKRNYESVTNVRLLRRTPVIVRVDGKCFHSLHLDKPFDMRFIEAMQFSTRGLAKKMQGFKLAYVQSDEASFLLTDFDTLTTEAWFGYELRKLCSVSASVMTERFNHFFQQRGCFDARAFNVPREEVANYFLWRMQDWQRNSVQMLAKANFSQRQLDRKNQKAMLDMLHEKGIHWSGFDAVSRRGTLFDKSGVPFTTEPKFCEIDAVIQRVMPKDSDA